MTEKSDSENDRHIHKWTKIVKMRSLTHSIVVTDLNHFSDERSLEVLIQFYALVYQHVLNNSMTYKSRENYKLRFNLFSIVTRFLQFGIAYIFQKPLQTNSVALVCGGRCAQDTTLSLPKMMSHASNRELQTRNQLRVLGETSKC